MIRSLYPTLPAYFKLSLSLSHSDDSGVAGCYYPPQLPGERRDHCRLHNGNERTLPPVPQTNAMESRSAFIPVFLPILALICSTTSASVDSNTTVFDILPQYGLPSGLLPEAVASYTIDHEGKFAVELDRSSCYVQFGSNLVFYGRRITGTLKLGSIRDLEGVQVQRLFLWLGVDEIKVDLPPSDYIYFQVGWISKRLLVEDFRNVHSCHDKAVYTNQFGLVRSIIITVLAYFF